MTHTKDMKYEMYPETNIAGGPSGAAYSYTAAASAAELTLVSYPYNEDQIMPFHVYDQEATEAPGQDISEKHTITKGIIYTMGKITQYMCDGKWLDWALGIAPAEAGGGAVPKTFLLQWTNGLATYTSYGCYITKYTLSGSASDKSLKEIVEFGHVKTEEEGCSFDDPYYDTVNAVATFEDVGTTTVTIEGNAVILNSFEVRVLPEYLPEDPHAGAYHLKFPKLSKRNVEIDMEFETDIYDEVLDAIFTTEAAVDDLTIVFTPLGKANFTADNMKVKTDSHNMNEIPSKGIKVHKVTFEIGGAGAFTTP